MKGFSLLEVIVAISILAVGIAGSVGLVSRVISAYSDVEIRLIAWNLAEEGIEVVRNIRDTNWIEGEAWDSGLSAGIYCANYNSASLIAPCSGASRNLYISANRYTHTSSASSTPFLRYINISDGVDASGGSYKKIETIVEWTGNSSAAELRLYDWK